MVAPVGRDKDGVIHIPKNAARCRIERIELSSKNCGALVDRRSLGQTTGLDGFCDRLSLSRCERDVQPSVGCGALVRMLPALAVAMGDAFGRDEAVYKTARGVNDFRTRQRDP